MAKFRAKTDLPPIKKGDIVEFNEPLVDGYKLHFESVGDNEETTGFETGDTETPGTNQPTGLIGNPDRNALKERANELKLYYAQNISTEKLVELVAAAEKEEAEKNA